jgi:hypothetical protein
VLLQPGMPATGLLNQLGDWRRIYADDVAVLYCAQRQLNDEGNAIGFVR